jgi:hypothetical protein
MPGCSLILAPQPFECSRRRGENPTAAAAKLTRTASCLCSSPEKIMQGVAKSTEPLYNTRSATEC